MDAFDADVLVYAGENGHHLGRRVRRLIGEAVSDQSGRATCIGSVVLLPEVLSRPLRDHDGNQVDALNLLLTRLDLRPVDAAVAQAAARLGAKYRLRAADATHLATAALAGADRFITNNRKDFPKTISEIDIVYPEDLPDPS